MKLDVENDATKYFLMVVGSSRRGSWRLSESYRSNLGDGQSTMLS